MNSKTSMIKRTLVMIAVIAALFAACIPVAACASSKDDSAYFTVVFDSNGGSHINTQLAENGGYVTKPVNPTKHGSEFGGWFKDAKLTSSWNFTRDVVTSDITLYARWNATEDQTLYIVTFEVDGGSEVAVQTVAKGGYAVKPANPTKSGYTFAGWFADSACTDEWEFANDTVNSNINIYAKWTSNSATVPDPEPKTYTVTFNSLGGSAVNLQVVEEGGVATEPITPVRDGYTFAGWFRNSSYTAPWYFASGKVNDDMTLYAKWIANPKPEPGSFSVIFDSLGGSGVVGQSVTDGGYVTKPSDPVRSGYAFDGWYTEASYAYKWNFATDAVTANITLFAKWNKIEIPEPEPGSFSVVFDSTGGSSVPAQNVADGEYVTKPSDPVRSGYAFDGWFKEEECVHAWDFAANTVSADIVLYAKWEKSADPTPVTNGVTVTFNVGLEARKAGLSNPAPQTVQSGSTVAQPTVARDGYTVVWYAEDGNAAWNFATSKVTTDTTLFARWTAGGSSEDKEDYTPTYKNDNVFYVHYRRKNSDYSNWHAWAWKDNGSGQWCESVAVDKSGTVCAIELSKFGSPDAINFKMAQGEWTASDGGDNRITLSAAQKVGNSYHWYIDQDNTSAGKNYLAKSGGDSSGAVTEPLRASRSDINRSYAQNLPVADTVSGWDEAGVGYQIFVASFCDSNGDGTGDLRGIINKLDYLDDYLNVDVLWLTPVQSSNSIHGYDCYDYYAIDSKFGTNADYRELVFKAHQRGMKVIMDLVVNHTSPQNEWFIKSKNGVVETVTYQDGTTAEVHYRDFYRWKDSGGSRYCSAGDGWYYYSSFGSSMPELNYDYQAARDAMADVAAYWMSYGLDGFRMDAIKHVYMWGESDDTGCEKGAPTDTGWEFNLTKNIEFFKEFNYKLKTRFPHAFLLGEQLCGDPTYVAPFYKGMDSLFDFNTYYDLPGKLSSGNAGAVADNFNNNASKYASNREDRPINSMISSNHDIPRLSKTFGSNADKMKLYLAITMTMPGISWIYYGDEIGLLQVGSPDNAYRQSMKWTSSYDNKCTVIGYGNDNNGIKSVAEQKTDSSSILSYVAKLTKLRNDYPALISGTATCSVTGSGLLKIVVKNSSQTVTVYHNLSDSSKTADGGGTLVFGDGSVKGWGTAVYVS